MLKQSNITDYLNIFKGDFCFQGLKLPFYYKQPEYQINIGSKCFQTLDKEWRKMNSSRS